MDPVIHLSEGRRSDVLLGLTGLTREERVMVQASISDERDFDRVADAFIIQHPRIHLRTRQRRTKGKGKNGFKRGDNSNIRWFRGEGKGKHTGSGKSGAVPLARTSLPFKITTMTTGTSERASLLFLRKRGRKW